MAPRNPFAHKISRVMATTVALLTLTTIGTTLALAPSASAAAPRWVLVGKETFTIDGNTTKVPTYVNTNSIVGDRYDTFTITFQGRFAGKYGVNRVNVGVIVDCEDAQAYADQFYVYYSSGSGDYERYDGGDISPRIQTRALSYCR
jgi:hypothetical protein